METQESVAQIINLLTRNEDYRQDLWVHYLSGHSIESLSSHLQGIVAEYSSHEELKENIWTAMNNPLPQPFIDFLSTFSDFERTIMSMLMLGLTISQISKFKGISEVRIRQTLSNIGYNEGWRKFNGTQEKPN